MLQGGDKGCVAPKSVGDRLAVELDWECRVEGVFRPPGESGSAAVRRQRERVRPPVTVARVGPKTPFRAHRSLTEPQAPIG
jgi:hypothetical protein